MSDAHVHERRRQSISCQKSLLWYWYNTSQDLCTRFAPCFVLLCFGSGRFYPRNSDTIVPVRKPWRACVNEPHESMNMMTSSKTFSALLAFCAGNSPITGEFPAQRPVTMSFGVFFDLRLNKRLSKQSWGWWSETPSRSLWRHCNEEMISESQQNKAQKMSIFHGMYFICFKALFIILAKTLQQPWPICRWDMCQLFSKHTSKSYYIE